MIQNYSVWLVLRPFFDDPNPKEGFTIRWVSREIGLSSTSVMLHLDKLSKEGEYGYPLVIRSKGRIYPTYWANRASNLFRFYKKMDIIFRLEESGFLRMLEERCSPDAIVLFGSAARGEDVAGSDVDILIVSQEKKLDMKKYESVLKRGISLHFCENFRKMPKELKNNIINGVILRGYIRVF
ncbi:MAG: nucleotidyltransferase domain-containing protein [Candidatus Aenigmarchaeota archaeon]|nr:nucleotidyltransferase domain-containing protein [Candidatus Aenigmarchaeota archaeon]